jgi:hypothetical protein
MFKVNLEILNQPLNELEPVYVPKVRLDQALRNIKESKKIMIRSVMKKKRMPETKLVECLKIMTQVQCNLPFLLER